MRSNLTVRVGLTVMLFCMLMLSVGFPGKAMAAKAPTQAIMDAEKDFADFEARLDSVRQALKIPGMSAAIVQDQKLIWSAGFGYADLENQVPAAPDTPYGLASVTKPVAAVLIMQLVEEGRIDLDAPIADYGVTQLGNEVTVRHLLTHTSEGVPGTKFEYNGSRYGMLAGVIEGATGKTFAKNLSERILLPVGMDNTALNPINAWGGLSGFSLDNFQRMLGWEDAYQAYPDVYARLAHPYQFDSDYNIIPGMYHLYHNTGAGLNASVTDLAKFDIALDQGLLLGDAAKAEMLSPAVSTYKNRPDLNYGLGWYVQDFSGLQLLWHTGRWSPSTSALYLKVPEKNLTWIVLANTDNLTVPFAGIGAGNVSQSTLVLTFWRYFIFPEQHGYTLPGIDWGADQAAILQQLAAVDDEPSREFLERELWSFRQAFASSGQTDQAEILRRVAINAFPGSAFSRDWMFTQTAAQYPVIPPALPAAFFVWLARGITLWAGLVFISAVWMAVLLARSAQFSRWSKILWWLSTLFLGPVSLALVYRLRASAGLKAPATWRRAWGSAALSVTAYALAWFAAIAWLLSMGDNPHPLTILGLTYLLPLFFGLFLIRIPLQWKQAQPWQTFTHSLLAEFITFNLGYAVFFSMTMVLSNRLLTQISQPTDPLFWGMTSFIAISGVIILTPLQYWMTRTGCSLPTGLRLSASESVLLAKFRAVWPVLLTTLAVMVAALIFTISQLN